MPILNHFEFHNCDKLFSTDALSVLSALSTFKKIDTNIKTEDAALSGIACAEIRYLTQLLIEPHLNSDNSHEGDGSNEVSLIRSRFENVFNLLLSLRSRSALAETVFPLIIELSRIIENVHKGAIFSFVEISSHNNTSVDIWSDVLRTSVVLAICTFCTREDLNIDFRASLSLRDTTVLLDSPFWQLQLQGLFLIRILLCKDRNHDSETVSAKAITILGDRLQGREKSPLSVSARQNGSTLTYSTASKKALSMSVKSSRQDGPRIMKLTKNKGEASLPNASRVLSTNGGRVDELCRSGSLRSIIWLLTNRREVVRKSAAEVLIAVVSACKQISITHNCQDTISISSDLWASLVEQGMVALLEAVSAGSRVFVPVNQFRKNGNYNDNVNNVNNALPQNCKQTLFPELKIRCVADFVLRQLTVVIEGSETLFTRLISAMLFSGNAKLRLNIFSSILFLAGRSDTLARRLWNLAPPRSTFTTTGILQQHAPTKRGLRDGVTVSAPTPPPRLLSSAEKEVVESRDFGGGALFRDAFSIASKDPAEFRCLLRLLLTLLAHSAMDKSMQPLLVREPPDIVSAEASTDTIRMIKAVAPIVIVNRAGAWTRMACPLLEVIYKHSLELGSNIQDSIAKQLRNFDYHCVPPELVSQRLNSFDDDCFLRLEGSYNIWQEVFSHMADSYLMKLSSANMSAEDLLAALTLARRWNMKILEINYAHVLSRRITNTTLISVLNFSVGYGSSTSFMHPMLCISSVDYLVKSCENINLKDIGDIIRGLTLLIERLLLL